MDKWKIEEKILHTDSEDETWMKRMATLGDLSCTQYTLGMLH